MLIIIDVGLIIVTFSFRDRIYLVLYNRGTFCILLGSKTSVLQIRLREIYALIKIKQLVRKVILGLPCGVLFSAFNCLSSFSRLK